MKKFLIVIFVMLLSLSAAGCNEQTPDSTEASQQQTITAFEAEVLEVFEGSILVAPSEGSAERNSSDRISVSVANLEVPFNLVVGQTVKIEYDGTIAESYPAQIHSASGMELIAEADDTNQQESWGVTLEAQNVTPTSLTLLCTQAGGTDIFELNTGSYFTIQKLEETDFVDVAYLPQEYEIAWTAEAWMIPLNDEVTWDIDWEWLYGELPAGEYRIGKEIMNFRGPGDYDQKTLYAYFEVQ